MEGLISHGRGDINRSFAAMSDGDRSSSSEPHFIPRQGATSAHQQGSLSKKKNTSARNGTQYKAGPSKPRTWKDKPGMAKKRKRTNVKPGWEYEEVDLDDEEVISSGSNIVTGSCPSTSQLEGKSNGSSLKRKTAVYDVDSSSDDSPSGGSSSESAEETDESFEHAKSQSKKKKNRGKQAEKPKPKVKQKDKKSKAGKKTPISENPAIKDIALSGLDNSVFVIGESLYSERGKY